MTHTKDEALRLADALEQATYLLSVERDNTAAELRRLHGENERLKAAQQEPVCRICNGTGEMDSGGTHPWGWAINIPCECTAPPAQPAPVQEPVAMTFDEAWASLSWQEWRMKSPKELFAELHRLTTPPAAQPAVPDAIGPNEDELPAYAAGWNDCRQAMLEMMK